jgi:hypothetical protein
VGGVAYECLSGQPSKIKFTWHLSQTGQWLEAFLESKWKLVSCSTQAPAKVDTIGLLEKVMNEIGFARMMEGSNWELELVR